MALRTEVRIRPEIRAAADKEPPPDIAPADIGLTAPRCGRVHRHQRRFEGGSAASSPVMRAAQSWGSTSLAGCSIGFRRSLISMAPRL